MWCWGRCSPRPRGVISTKRGNHLFIHTALHLCDHQCDQYQAVASRPAIWREKAIPSAARKCINYIIMAHFPSTDSGATTAHRIAREREEDRRRIHCLFTTINRVPNGWSSRGDLLLTIPRKSVQHCPYLQQTVPFQPYIHEQCQSATCPHRNMRTKPHHSDGNFRWSVTQYAFQSFRTRFSWAPL
jgi:hypothetical protein